MSAIRSWIVGFGVCVTATLAAQQAGAPQSSQPTFRSGSDLVRVDVVVVDKNGNAVTGLKASDFTLLDRKKPQTIAAFVEETHDPEARADRGAAAPVFPPVLRMDVATNQLPPDDRLVVIVVDDLHLYKNRTDLAKKLARDVFTKLGSGSDAAVLFTSGDHDTQVTQQSSEILAAIDTVKGRRAIPRPVWANDNMRYMSVDPDHSLQNLYDDLQTYKTFEDAAKLLERVPADRKAFVVISEGIGKDLTGAFEGGVGDPTSCDGRGGRPDRITVSVNPCYHDISLRQMMAPIRRANATVYALDPRGLVESKDLLRECFGGTGWNMGDPCLGDDDMANPTDMSSWVRQAQQGLEITAKTTGGIAVTNTNDFSTGIDRIVSDIDHYYLLGFRPEASEKGYHALEIRVDRPGLTVRARNGYEVGNADAAAKSKNTDPLAKLVEGLLPASDLPLRLFAAPMPDAGKKTARVAVALEITAPVNPLLESDHRLHDEVSYDVFVINDKKSKVTSRSASAARLVLAPSDRGAMPGTVTYQVPLAFDLAPGEYQLRASAMSKKLGEGGSVYLTVDVPDFSKEAIALGGISVGYADGAHVPVGHLAGGGTTATHAIAPGIYVSPAQFAAMRAAEAALPFDPSLSREFLSTDTMRVYAEVARKTASAATVDVALVGASDHIVTSSSHDLDARAPGVVDLRFPLAGVAPGVYRLRMTAADGTHTAMREVGIIVR